LLPKRGYRVGSRFENVKRPLPSSKGAFAFDARRLLCFTARDVVAIRRICDGENPFQGGVERPRFVRRYGLGTAELHQILVDNPRRFLAFIPTQPFARV
jgi:hypothetical protein